MYLLPTATLHHWLPLRVRPSAPSTSSSTLRRTAICLRSSPKQAGQAVRQAGAGLVRADHVAQSLSRPQHSASRFEDSKRVPGPSLAGQARRLWRQGAALPTAKRINRGTPYHYPQALRGQYDKKSDVWALGCVLYELCTRHAFEGRNMCALVLRIVRASMHSRWPALGFTMDMRRLVDSLSHKSHQTADCFHDSEEAIHSGTHSADGAAQRVEGARDHGFVGQVLGKEVERRQEWSGGE